MYSATYANVFLYRGHPSALKDVILYKECTKTIEGLTLPVDIAYIMS